jgi:SAM-dependent methyltransferase
MARSEEVTRGPTGSDNQRAATARVAAHYERWPFPGIDHGSREGLILLRDLSEWLATGETDRRTPRVIDVGCGTGHTVIALAKHFPEVEFIGIDAAPGALDLARAQRESAGIENVMFELADIQKDLPAWDPFDIVLCLGVLHHVPHFAEAFARVAGLVKGEGHLVVWLYGRFGRARHLLNQKFVELLAGEDPEKRLAIAHAFMEELGSRFAVDSGFYTPRGSGLEGVEWLLEQPQWLADQMVPALEYSLSLSEILDLFSDHSLDFVKWLGVPTEVSHYSSDVRLIDRFRALSSRDRLRAIDYLVKPSYYFVAGRKVPS